VILRVLGDGVPRGSREVLRLTKLGEDAVWSGLRRLWREGRVLRSERPVLERKGVFRGRAGKSRNLRRYYLFLAGSEARLVDGFWFRPFSEVLDGDSRGHRGGVSKVQIIRSFLEEHSDCAFYSKRICDALKDRGIEKPDVMTAIRFLEKLGLVYVRGYQTGSKATPFKEGYLTTWIDPSKPRDLALREAVDRTTKALEGEVATNPIIARVHLIKDQIVASSHLRELVSSQQIVEKLGGTEDEANQAIARTLQLYPDLREVKIFNLWRYFYHASLAEEDLRAALAMQENYIRMTRGRANRVGHNWEACVEWFIDTFTRGAEFQTQEHRTRGMDPGRITLHLIKPVGGRRQNAEVDRVWTVTPGVFAQPITYVLECKWGLVKKKDVDDFLEILRWSKEFGVDTEQGRVVKQGVVGIFAGGAFNPHDKIHIKDEEINLPTYAARHNLQLLHASDFNQRLQERGIPKEVTVQKICRSARDEDEVREALAKVWEKPRNAEGIVTALAEKNEDIYRLESAMESGREERKQLIEDEIAS
jgi:hypothetical protein